MLSECFLLDRGNTWQTISLALSIARQDSGFVKLSEVEMAITGEHTQGALILLMISGLIQRGANCPILFVGQFTIL